VGHTAIQVIDIIPGTSVDGPGLRTSIYIAGCRHQCPQCHNPHTWDFNQGSPMTVGEIMEIVEENGFNVTLTGGDPIYSLPAVLPLAKAIHDAGYTIWLYTGFTFEHLLVMPLAQQIFPFVEAIVDGPFEIESRDISLCFRGSANQRIVDVRSSLMSGATVTFDY